jgi:hypothetical protein
MSRLTRRWTDQQLVEAAESSRSVAQVLKLLRLNPTGANYHTIWRYTSRLGIDTSHWTGKGSNRGPRHVGGSDKLGFEAVLVLNRRDGIKEATDRLRRAMVESGISEVCGECGIGQTWNERPLVLSIDHRNGNSLDNRPWNVRFLCPNCHSQTPNFGAKNIGKVYGGM